jgi:hypothetical protein
MPTIKTGDNARDPRGWAPEVDEDGYSTHISRNETSLQTPRRAPQCNAARHAPVRGMVAKESRSIRPSALSPLLDTRGPQYAQRK